MRGKSKFFSLLLVALILIAIIVVPVAAKAPVVNASPGVAVVMQEDAAVPTPIDNVFKEVLGAGAIMWFITGIVTYVKKFGVKGKWLTASAMILGLLLAGGYKILIKPPTAPLDWFLAVLYGLGCGLIATGVYDSYGKNTNPAG